MSGFWRSERRLPAEGEALPGRADPVVVVDPHLVLGTSMAPPFPRGTEQAVFGMGCFWGPERTFWEADGVFTTAVGYAGGVTPNPTYDEVCSGLTGHTEVVLVVYDHRRTSYERLLRLFWENHDPTQGMRQGNDLGTQYRSAIYWTSDEQGRLADESRRSYQAALDEAGYGEITTEMQRLSAFYYAEPLHQQYLVRNPSGFCGLGGTGVSCPVGLSAGGGPTD